MDFVGTGRTMAADVAGKMIGETVPTLLPNIHSAQLVVDGDTGEPVLAYLPLDRTAVGDLRRAVLATSGASYTAYRAGLRNASRTFGWTPRRPLYGREGCQPASMAIDNPDTERVLDEWASRLIDMLREIVPDRVEADRSTVAAVDADWKLGETHYTSGVINRSAQLPYHRDVFNYPVWSAMPVLRRGVTGGYLSVPEYDLVVPCRDGWAVFFPGQQLVHGVTPMRQTAVDGYRYSIVYYSLRGLKDCFSAAVEATYARRRRTERERDIASRVAEGNLSPANGRSATSMRKKQSGRLIGGRSGAALSGDPTAIEDAYLDQLET
jgi:hypothetical protein